MKKPYSIYILEFLNISDGPGAGGDPNPPPSDNGKDKKDQRD